MVLPSLALIDETAAPAFTEVRRELGIGTVVYHFVAEPGAGLSGHQGAHVGTGLANGHSAAARDFETIRSRARAARGPGRRDGRRRGAGLVRAHALLAAAIAPGQPGTRRVRRAAASRPR